MTDYEEVEIKGWEWCGYDDRAVLTGAHAATGDMHYPLYYRRPKKEPCETPLVLIVTDMDRTLACQLDVDHDGNHYAEDEGRREVWWT